MTLVELLNKANKGYPGEFLSEYFNKAGERKNEDVGGDTLAQFIVNELIETFDPKASDGDQLSHAAHVLVRAEHDLVSVIATLLQ